jgi:hypothetical protein
LALPSSDLTPWRLSACAAIRANFYYGKAQPSYFVGKSRKGVQKKNHHPSLSLPSVQTVTDDSISNIVSIGMMKRARSSTVRGTVS